MEVCKVLGLIWVVTNSISLAEGTHPGRCPARRRSPKEEDLEKGSMEKLLDMGVAEHTSSPSAECNVFGRKIDSSISVT